MTTEELLEKLNEIQKRRCETRTLEIKAAKEGCPRHLYDTLSAFSNQDDGGTIIFGIDEENNYDPCGVYDPQDLQKKIAVAAVPADGTAGTPVADRCGKRREGFCFCGNSRRGYCGAALLL